MPGPHVLHRLGDGGIRFHSGDAAFGSVPCSGVKHALDTYCRGTTRLFVWDGMAAYQGLAPLVKLFRPYRG